MTEELALEPRLERVREFRERDATDELRSYLSGFHPSDIADLLEALEEADRLAVLSLLPDELASETLAEMEEEEHPETLLLADPDRMPELIRELSDDDAADLIGELAPEQQREVLARLPLAEAGGLRELLAYDEESAGGIMTTEVVAVLETLSVADAIEEIRRQAGKVDEVFTVFVVDAHGGLKGTVSLQGLVLSAPTRSLQEVVEPPRAVVPDGMDQEEVARVMSRYNLVSVPVVDAVGRLLGRITFDDVMDILEAETTEDILRLAGVPDEEQLRGGMRESIRSRLPWLYMNLVTAGAAAAVVYVFQSTIERAVLLAVFMPVIAGMGGNAGTQALAVTVRRLALSPVRDGSWEVVFKEMGVGLVNGAATGIVAAFVGYVLAGSLILGAVVMLAMWFNLVIAGFAGAFVPVLLERMGADPAVASSVFVTTLTDLCGFFLLLGMATLILLPGL